MAKEEKKFYPFTVNIDEEKRRKKLEALKAKFPFSSILNVLALNEDDDEVTLENKLRAAMAQELLAMDNALANQDYQMAKSYQESTDRNGNKVEGKISDLADFFAQYDEYRQDYENDYINYLMKRDEITEKKINDAVDPSDSEYYTESMKAADLAANETRHLDSIEAFTKFTSLEEKAEIWESSFSALSKNPTEVNRSLIKFYQQCKKENKVDTVFNKIYDEFLAESENGFASYPNKDGKIINEHRFNLDKDGHVVHSILNLQDTGLNISWVDDKLGLAHCNMQLTKEQIKALAQYCALNGISIDQALKLNDLSVVDEQGNNIATAADALREEIEKQLQRENGANQQAENAISGIANDNSVNDDFGQFLPRQEPIKVSNSKMVEACKKRIGLMGYPPESGLVSVNRGWNSTIISVYASENDRLDDGQVDKDGHRKHTKQFAVKLINSTPPQGYIYPGNIREFKADHARLFLDAFKATGCKYFILPPAFEIGGKDVNAAFIKASVKTGMIPYLKGSKDGRGCDIGAPDIETIMEELPKEPGMNAREKTEFLMRWSQQVDKYMSWNTKAAKTLADGAGKLRQNARFQMFTAEYLNNLQKYIIEGMAGNVDGRKWDNVDQITATIAMNKIIKGIAKGELNGKPYNPLGDNDEILKKTLKIYMQAERPNIEKSIMSEIEKAKEHDDTERGKNKAAANVLLNRARGELNNTTRELEVYGIKMNVDIVSSDKVWYPSKNNTFDESRSSTDSQRRGRGNKDDEDERRRRALRNPMYRAGYTR